MWGLSVVVGLCWAMVITCVFLEWISIDGGHRLVYSGV